MPPPDMSRRRCTSIGLLTEKCRRSKSRTEGHCPTDLESVLWESIRTGLGESQMTLALSELSSQPTAYARDSGWSGLLEPGGTSAARGPFENRFFSMRGPNAFLLSQRLHLAQPPKASQHVNFNEQIFKRFDCGDAIQDRQPGACKPVLPPNPPRLACPLLPKPLRPAPEFVRLRRVAGVAELVDALVLGTSIVRCGGSSPFARTSFPPCVRMRPSMVMRKKA